MTIHRIRGRDAARAIPDPVDITHVDGDHRHGAVMADVRGGWPWLRAGGRMAFDDYHPGGWWGDGIVRAVAKVLAAPVAIVDWKAGDQIALDKTGAA